MLYQIFILTFIVCSFSCHALDTNLPYFYVQEGKEKCFIEDVAEGIPLSITYNKYDNVGVNCSIVLKDFKGHEIHRHLVTESNSFGKLGIVSKTSGEHQVCVECVSAQWFATSQIKWSLSINIGDNDLNLTEIAKAHHIDDLAGVLRLLEQKLSVLAAENEYEKNQEEHYKRITEKINSRVVIFALIQIVVMVGATLFSILHLSRYFHAQKLY